MALRIRANGEVLCAAMHGVKPGDLYLDDAQHYTLAAEWGLLISEPMDPTPDNPGLGGHRAHGQWWWRGLAPAEAVIEEEP